MATIIKNKVKEFMAMDELNILLAIQNTSRWDAINKYTKPIRYITSQLTILNSTLKKYFATGKDLCKADSKLLNRLNTLNIDICNGLNVLNNKHHSLMSAIAEFNRQCIVCEELTVEFKKFRQDDKNYIQKIGLLQSSY